MPAISVRDALIENEDRKADLCDTCDNPADETTEPYCVHCASYWQDVREGLFDEYEDQHHDQ